jgi:hypothetical protein
MGCLTTGWIRLARVYDRWRELVYEWAKHRVERCRRREDMAFADVERDCLDPIVTGANCATRRKAL